MAGFFQKKPAIYFSYGLFKYFYKYYHVNKKEGDNDSYLQC